MNIRCVMLLCVLLVFAGGAWSSGDASASRSFDVDANAAGDAARISPSQLGYSVEPGASPGGAIKATRTARRGPFMTLEVLNVSITAAGVVAEPGRGACVVSVDRSTGTAGRTPKPAADSAVTTALFDAIETELKRR